MEKFRISVARDGFRIKFVSKGAQKLYTSKAKQHARSDELLSEIEVLHESEGESE